jgi:hypothetical protein
MPPDGVADQGAPEGRTPMSARLTSTRLVDVPYFLLHNHHAADDCGVVFAAFRGFASPLRHTEALVSCRSGGHEIWWRTAAQDEAAALRQLPRYVATNSTATRVNPVAVP